MDFMLLGAVEWWAQSLAVLFFVICVFLIILVLLQKGRGGGLAGAFGGAGGQSAFGSKTGDVFTWVTIVVVAVFLLLAMFLTVNYKPAQPEEDLLGIGSPATSQTQEMPGSEDQPAEEGSVDTEASAPVETEAQPETESASDTENAAGGGDAK